VVEAYAMEPRARADIAATWQAHFARKRDHRSPSVGVRLAEAVGAQALQDSCAVVAMGTTTAQALRALDVLATVPASADFVAVAKHLGHLWASRDDV
jgi:hypothetical protein